MKPIVKGIYETHLTVSNLQRSIAFYRNIIGLELAIEIPDRSLAFMWANEKHEGMLGLWEIGDIPMGLKLHFAFKTSLEHVLQSAAYLKSKGVQPLGFSGEPAEEPVVLGWMPAVSQYFDDPDGHRLEYIHVLDEPSDEDFGDQPYSVWQKFKARK